MLFSEIGAGNDVETAALVNLLQGRCKTKETTRANAAAAMRAVVIDAQCFVAVVSSHPSLAPPVDSVLQEEHRRKRGPRGTGTKRDRDQEGRNVTFTLIIVLS